MNQRLALRLIGDIMEWDDERADKEFNWLRLMSRMKYDAYGGFFAGMRFLESLLNWIQQFEDVDERDIAYKFVKGRLLYVGQLEVLRLVELLYPIHVRQRLVKAVSESLAIPPFKVWADSEAFKQYGLLRRKTLFMGMSDGARLDLFRRSTTRTISNEQIVASTQLDDEKWADLTKELIEATEDPNAKFAFIYLMDDFAASGMSLLRKDGDKWKGKLVRFWDNVSKHTDVLEDNWVVCVHHHLAFEKAKSAIAVTFARATEEREGEWFPNKVEFSYGATLPNSLAVSTEQDSDFLALIEKYYDQSIMTRHHAVGGTEDMKFGFNGCALPLVLSHNTPNNSVALLWAQSDGQDGAHAMRPLFRRVERHT